MFLQVELQEKDCPYHRFLWRNLDTSREPDVYERLVFGNTASPFCSQHVLHAHAERHGADYPEAAETVDNAMYVADMLDSCETIEEAKNPRHQLSDLLSMASFKLRKWSSNETAVLEDVPVEDRQPSLEIREEGTPKINTFQVEQHGACKEPTKQSVLSAIAALFDPLQFLSPLTMRAKVGRLALTGMMFCQKS